MPRRSLRRALAIVTVVAASLVACTLTLAPTAQAFESRPTTADDSVTLDAGDVKVVDVLANDTNPGGSHDDLAVCRYTLPDGSPLSVDIRDTGIAVSTPITVSGTFTLTYYACNYSYLTPGTLTVNVTKVPAVTGGKVSGRPGHVRFTNPGDQPVRVTYSVPSGEGPEGKVEVKAHGSAIVTVTRPKIIYVAVRKSGAIVGYGTIRGIKVKGHKKHARHHTS